MTGVWKTQRDGEGRDERWSCRPLRSAAGRLRLNDGDLDERKRTNGKVDASCGPESRKFVPSTKTTLCLRPFQQSGCPINSPF